MKKAAVARGPAATTARNGSRLARNLGQRQPDHARNSTASGTQRSAPCTLVSPASAARPATIHHLPCLANQKAPTAKTRKRDSVNVDSRKKAVGKKAR